jgi:hypothetical protein
MSVFNTLADRCGQVSDMSPGKHDPYWIAKYPRYLQMMAWSEIVVGALFFLGGLMLTVNGDRPPIIVAMIFGGWLACFVGITTAWTGKFLEAQRTRISALERRMEFLQTQAKGAALARLDRYVEGSTIEPLGTSDSETRVKRVQ